MQLINRITRRVRIGVGVALAVLVALAGTRVGVAIVAKAAGIPTNAQGIGGFVNGAQALVDPALVMVAAVAPLALIAGGLVLLFGGRRGMQIIGTSLGVLLRARQRDGADQLTGSAVRPVRVERDQKDAIAPAQRGDRGPGGMTRSRRQLLAPRRSGAGRGAAALRRLSSRRRTALPIGPIDVDPPRRARGRSSAGSRAGSRSSR